MSELAFNANGESFEIPATVTGWRVRRMKPRGAPELVYGRDGRPLGTRTARLTPPGSLAFTRTEWSETMVQRKTPLKSRGV